jgi:hypothetical protein
MRGRKPKRVTLPREHVVVLESLLRSEQTAKHVARRAQILLALHAYERTGPIADRTARHRTTVWRVCQRYETFGLEAVYHANCHPSNRLPPYPPLGCAAAGRG